MVIKLWLLSPQTQITFFLVKLSLGRLVTLNSHIYKGEKEKTTTYILIIIIFRLGDNLYKKYFIITNSNDTQLTNEDSESQTGYKSCLRITGHYLRAQGFDSRAASFESPRCKSRCCTEHWYFMQYLIFFLCKLYCISQHILFQYTTF